ncbi:MAG: GlyGly-CTERM sorting domain-containing protein [Cupriavidus sp.]|nr:MAG: GlyGly-CTERM sorting domain-containing protein [Cupriavidus sp.]
MAQDDKNKQAREGLVPSFRIPSAAKLACMGLLSGASALPGVASAGAVVITPPSVTAVDDHYVTPADTALTSDGAAVKPLSYNDKYGDNVISTLSTCPGDGNTQPFMSISLITPPAHGNVIFSHTICDNSGTVPDDRSTPYSAVSPSKVSSLNGGSISNFGSFQYTPEAGFTGTDSFVYSLSVGESAPSNATASILVGKQFTISGGALDALLLAPLAAAGWARRRKKSGSDQ